MSKWMRQVVLACESHQGRHSAETHCNILQIRTTLHHTAPHCTTLHHTAPHCTTLLNATRCFGLRVTSDILLQHTATHCNTRRHTATHCNTLQHTALLNATRCFGSRVASRQTRCCNSLQLTAHPSRHSMCYYGVATISRMLKNIGLFCKRALQKRPVFCKETCIFKHPTHRSHPIRVLSVGWLRSVGSIKL